MISYDDFRAAWLGTDDPDVKEYNKKLCERYPFLLPRYEWSQEPLEDYDYEFTNLDDMPKGWRKAFGIQMFEELRDILIKYNFLDEYRIVQLKEKFGSLRLYDDGIPREMHDEYYEWMNKYEDLSEKTCICCGKPGKMVTIGWMSPYCPECFEKYYNGMDYEEWTR